MTSILLATVLLLVPFAMTAQAQAPASPWVPTDRLTHVQPAADSDFGQAADIDGDVAVVGDPSQDRAHVYERTGTTWLQTQTLTGPDGFGSSVAVDGDSLVVGTPWASTVHVYESGVGAWQETATLGVSGAGCLGTSVDLDARTVVAGDPCSTDSAYGFERTSTGWVRVAEVTVPDESSFGRDVAVSQDTIAIAAGGTAYAVEATSSGWTEPTELVADESAGWSVDVDKETIAVGGTGLAVVYGQGADGSWAPEATIEPADASSFEGGASFGSAVAVAEDTLIVGAHRDDWGPGAPATPSVGSEQCVSRFGFGACIPERPGSAYVFDGSDGTWDQVAKLSGSVAGDDKFGAAVALDEAGSEILVGAPHNLQSAVGGAIDVDAVDSVHVFSKVVDA